MMFLITGQPGASKTAWTMTNLRDVVRKNKINIQKNRVVYESNKELFEKYKDEFSYYIQEIGSGFAITKNLVPLPFDYVDFINHDFDDIDSEYNGTPPDFYYQRIAIYNDIMDRIEETYGKVGLNRFQPVRTIYTNIKSCKLEGVRPLIFDWRDAPDGSIFAIDEIQKVEPYCNKKSNHPMIIDLTEHRHRGFDFYIITQSTTYVHPDMRDLFTIHWHVTRPYGRTPVVLQWGAFKQYPSTFFNKFNAESKIKFKVDPDIFKLYKSTSIDTHKKRTPAGLGILVGGVLVGGSLMAWGLLDLNSTDPKPNQTSNQQKQTSNEQKQTFQKDSEIIASSDLLDKCRYGVNVEKPECQAFFDSLEATNSSIDSSGLRYYGNRPYDFQYIPTDFKPSDFPRFSNAIVYKGVCYALSQQGTIMHDVSKKDCLRLASGDRPFNYFANPDRTTSSDGGDNTKHLAHTSNNTSTGEIADTSHKDNSNEKLKNNELSFPEQQAPI